MRAISVTQMISSPGHHACRLRSDLSPGLIESWLDGIVLVHSTCMWLEAPTNICLTHELET